MLSVFGFVAFIVHASIFCLRFSQKQSANQPKKIQGNGLLLNIKAHAKIQALLKEKKFYPKKSLTSLLHQAIQFLSSRCQIRRGYVTAKDMVSQNTRKSCRLVKSMNIFEKKKVVSLFFRQSQDQRKEESI